MSKERIGGALHTALSVCICFSLVVFSVIQIRYGAAVIGLLPGPQAKAYAAETLPVYSNTSGKATVSVEYCSEAIALADSNNPSGKTSTTLNFDDTWFRKDAGFYNHGLATACSVLSAVCNSESQFYGNVEGATPYAEQALGALGFSNIRSESYALRSDLFDQIATFFVGSYDVSAYVLASKVLPGEGDNPDETLIFVGVRGSYGIEWLSNLRLFDGSAKNADHPGFTSTKEEVMTALEQYAKEIGANPLDTKILLTGHSRGGALANLLAAELDDRGNTPQRLASTDSIFAYTFATPGTTTVSDCGSANYENIFNVVNPTDFVPQFPFSSWGYGRYGTTVVLPDAQNQKFTSMYEAMQNNYQNNTGCLNPCSAEDISLLTSLDTGAANVVPTIESMWNPQVLLSTMQTMNKIDVPTVLSAHYPDTYIAWMQSMKAEQVSLR